MVIEHKITVYPPDYHKYHRAHHFFMKNLSVVLSPKFDDDLYMIEINIKDVEVKESEISRIITGLVEQVLRDKYKLVEAFDITGISPIPWLVRRASESEREYGKAMHGLVINLQETPIYRLLAFTSG